LDTPHSQTKVLVVSGLSYGLNERAIDAARRIRFTPAKKDGVPVSMYVQVQYNFNLLTVDVKPALNNSNFEIL
jgi:periplasmic protein TonB